MNIKKLIISKTKLELKSFHTKIQYYDNQKWKRKSMELYIIFIFSNLTNWLFTKFM